MGCPGSHFPDIGPFPPGNARLSGKFQIPGEWVLNWGNRVRVRMVTPKIGQIQGQSYPLEFLFGLRLVPHIYEQHLFSDIRACRKCTT